MDIERWIQEIDGYAYALRISLDGAGDDYARLVELEHACSDAITALSYLDYKIKGEKQLTKEHEVRI
jgi:hypothetical protein